jgi:hypothetical protein
VSSKRMSRKSHEGAEGVKDMKRRKEFRKPYGQVRSSAAPVTPVSRSASNELTSFSSSH